MCGEGVPDFYAKEVIGKFPYCINPLADTMLKDYYESEGICSDMNDLGYRKDENDDFVIEDCLKTIFARYYYTKQGQTAFDALYTNRKSMRDKFIAFWDVVSSRLAGNPFVVGFDPLNEPPALNNVKNPEISQPGVMDKEYLTPFYSKLFEQYSANDAESIMWFEPVTIPNVDGVLDGGTIHPVGFKEPPGGHFGSKNHVLNDHTYCCQLGEDFEHCAERGEPNPAMAEKCLVWHDKRIG